jgi:hypothetical protein
VTTGAGTVTHSSYGRHRPFVPVGQPLVIAVRRTGGRRPSDIQEAGVTDLGIWPDEATFVAEDHRRAVSDEVDLGATWRAAGSNDAWRLAWLRDTGELYACRADGYAGSCSDVHVLAVLRRESDLDAALSGWREERTDPDGLSWVRGRVSPLLMAG